jgi:hypothetical protein
MRLINPNTERKMWVQEFTGELRDPETLARQIAATVASAAIAFKPPQ